MMIILLTICLFIAQIRKSPIMRVYNLILKTIFPFIFFRSIYKSLKFGENLSKRIMEKFSFYGGEKSSKPIILIHAVSVGEVLASRKFVEEIKKRFPDHQILITCTTQTGSETIKRLYGDSVLHQYMPFDLKFCINRFLKIWKPEMTFILETEIWPNFINLLISKKEKFFWSMAECQKNLSKDINYYANS